MNRIILSSVMVLLYSLTFAQSTQRQIQSYLDRHAAELELGDQKQWEITDSHTDETSKITYVYVRQLHNKLPIYNGLATFAISEDNVILSGNRLVKGTITANETTPKLTASEAIQAACRALEIPITETLTLLESKENEFVFEDDKISQNPIPVRLVYAYNNEELQLAWELSIYEISSNHWWSLRIDAHTGEEIDRNDWVASCNLDGVQFSHINHDHSALMEITTPSPLPLLPVTPATDEYTVFALPVESPNHGGRTLVTGPADLVASPYGWHDTNGAVGAEFTNTNGNNVVAQEDANGNNGTGARPSGGASLQFNFPLNMNQTASNYQDAAITNLFYMNNMMHDIWYHYGFDEASGNFQENNYGNGGAASDNVNADAQDGGGMNNANFATPPDGQNPRMQMYLWNNPGPQLLTINSPGSLAGGYMALAAGFGPALTTTPITSDFVLYDDNVPDAVDACEAPVNGPSMSGKIVVIRRGNCAFVDKVTRAQNEGALAVIMVNNVAGAPFAMGGAGPGVTIPSVMVSDIDGEAIIAEIESGGTVNGTLVDAPAFDLDGDFDNGIIAHEYGHGISTRLTGGASNSNCLNNNEQMGEGWSDWFALMLTMQPGDVSTDNRGMGTWVMGESTSGVGIRPVPYNTDFAVNNYTYANTNAGVSVPHGIGFVWCTILWDMSWALIDQYGYDPDLYNGIGGNNIAMNLVIQGLKLQPCGPGFVDGRDAILQADQLLYGGANQCLLWNVFANRGLGFSADQGSATSRSDQTEAFDLPSGIGNLTTSVSESACGSYTWSANGQTYTTSGTYVETILASTGCDSTITLNLTITGGTTGSTETVSNCNSYTWAANGLTYTSSGTYSETLTGTNGCDSIVTLDLTITTPSTSTETVVNCNSYTWSTNGFTYTSSGTYSETLTGSNGCDSIVTLDLTITVPTTSTETVVDCSAYTWSANGLTYNSSGTYTETLTNANGCDSVVTLNLTIATNYATDVVTSCGSYAWIDGNTYTSDNTTATFTLTNVAGCDSIVTLDLTIHPIYSETEVVTACTDYVWSATGSTYTSSGNYTANLTSSSGCDSTVTLDLTISNVAATSQSATACGSYQWALNGTTYNTSGQYIETVMAQSGCDSTVTLNLTITQPTTGLETATNCESYFWAANGTTYTNSGQYTTVLVNSNGCDSTVTLNLTILPASAPTTETVSACDSYVWGANNTTYTTSGQYSASLVNSLGCDSLATLDLNITSSYAATEQVTICDSYIWPVNGQTYTSTGTYDALYTTVAGCDSTFTLDLVIETTDATASMVDDFTITANTANASYQWVDCNDNFSAISGATSQTYQPTANGLYAVVVTSGNCADTSACFTVNKIGLQEFSTTSVQVFPNPNDGQFRIVFGNELQHVRVKCTNAPGQLIEERVFNSASEIAWKLDAATGVYFLEIEADGLQKTMIRVLKN